jgi:hypothetical protein
VGSAAVAAAGVAALFIPTRRRATEVEEKTVKSAPAPAPVLETTSH